jgi:hypothetical protein
MLGLLTPLENTLGDLLSAALLIIRIALKELASAAPTETGGRPLGGS